jgi:hypothetical protein
VDLGQGKGGEQEGKRGGQDADLQGVVTARGGGMQEAVASRGGGEGGHLSVGAHVGLPSLRVGAQGSQQQQLWQGGVPAPLSASAAAAGVGACPSAAAGAGAGAAGTATAAAAEAAADALWECEGDGDDFVVVTSPGSPSGKDLAQHEQLQQRQQPQAGGWGASFSKARPAFFQVGVDLGVGVCVQTHEVAAAPAAAGRGTIVVQARCANF